MSDIECAYNFFPLFFCHASLATRHTDREQGGRSSRTRSQSLDDIPKVCDKGKGRAEMRTCEVAENATLTLPLSGIFGEGGICQRIRNGMDGSVV